MNQLVIDIKYLNEQMNNMYINKQTTVKAGFNINSAKNFTNAKTTSKNILLNIIHIGSLSGHYWVIIASL